MSGIMGIKRCGTCHFGKIIPQDVTKRICWGAPPSAIQVPAPHGQMTLQMARPIVNVSDEACALYRDKTAVDRTLDADAFNTLQQQPETKQ